MQQLGHLMQSRSDGRGRIGTAGHGTPGIIGFAELERYFLEWDPELFRGNLSECGVGTGPNIVSSALDSRAPVGPHLNFSCGVALMGWISGSGHAPAD